MKKKSNWWKWALGLLIGIMLFPFLLKQISPDFAARVERDKTRKGSHAVVESVTATRSLETLLKSQNLELCEVYKWLERMEATTRNEIEQKHPTMSFIDREKQLTDLKRSEWMAYCKEHNLPDSIRVDVNVFGIAKCQ